MNCDTYIQLLDKAMNGDATTSELEDMRMHEQSCSDCAKLHHDYEALRNELTSLNDEVPPMPQDFHQRWTTLVEEDTMEKQGKNIRFRQQFTRFISVAAALVFVIGGTLLTRDDLAPRSNTYQSKSSNKAYETTSYDDAAYGGTPMMMSGRAYANTSMTSYSDDVAYDLAEEAEYEFTDNGSEGGQVNPSKIIRTASLTIATRNYEASMEQLRAAVEQHHGWISYCNETTTSNSLHRANLTLRIPSQSLDAFLNATGDVGRVTARSETADDVSDSYYDTKTRLATQEALLARLQALITDAASLSDLLKLESQIADTQYTIDRLTGSLRATDRQVDYATVDVTLREESAADEIVQTDLTLGQRIVSAFATGWQAFADLVEDMIVFMVAALPFIAMVAVAVIVIRLILRARRKNKK